ncbi:chromobox protein homolog 3-like [Metopolophium dirhodum]|uniref:chromobox protein homolog 3-like n=1 Tax=Metopolophium dirhodum TaxID=44670 RepID=UPI00298F6DC0|nr:chromobox protein homolog 3-like [Metopolophium dirhodum]
MSSRAKKVEQEDEYIVEKIVDKRVINNKVEYFLKWHGYDETTNTWEPEENLHCEELIRDFEQKQKEKDRNKKEEIERGHKYPLSNSTVTSCASSEAGPSKERTNNSFPQTMIEVEKTDESNKSDLTVNNDNIDGSEKNMSEKMENNVTNQTKKIVEKIISAGFLNGQLTFLLKWEGIEKLDVIPAEKANLMCPQIVIKFYEERVGWRAFCDDKFDINYDIMDKVDNH